MRFSISKGLAFGNQLRPGLETTTAPVPLRDERLRVHDLLLIALIVQEWPTCPLGSRMGEHVQPYLFPRPVFANGGDISRTRDDPNPVLPRANGRSQHGPPQSASAVQAEDHDLRLVGRLPGCSPSAPRVVRPNGRLASGLLVTRVRVVHAFVLFPPI